MVKSGNSVCSHSGWICCGGVTSRLSGCPTHALEVYPWRIKVFNLYFLSSHISFDECLLGFELWTRLPRMLFLTFFFKLQQHFEKYQESPWWCWIQLPWTIARFCVDCLFASSSCSLSDVSETWEFFGILIYFAFVMRSYCSWNKASNKAWSKGQKMEIMETLLWSSCSHLQLRWIISGPRRPKLTLANPSAESPLTQTVDWFILPGPVAACSSAGLTLAHKHRRCHINQTSVCNCPPNGMRWYRFMELSGRLISDSDNRVLMTPFMPFFFRMCVSLQPC